MTDPHLIRYRFDLPDGSRTVLDFTFDAADFHLTNEVPAEPPFWTDLKFNQCANCPLDAAEHPHCPAALQMTSTMSSVLGLIMATAGCPWTDRFRPMARFHLPFANETETVYRSISMFLLARELGGAGHMQGFAELEKLYESLHVVNRGMARRLGAATRTDPAQNAMALLDSYTTLLPAALEGSLEELKPLFDAWLKVGNPSPI
jgi:hypothetical protein